MSNPQLLTVAEAAELAGTTEKAIRRRIERGVLPKASGTDGRVRVPASALGVEAPPARASASAQTPPGQLTGTLVDPRPASAEIRTSELLDRIERLARELGRAEAQLARKRWWR